MGDKKVNAFFKPPRHGMLCIKDTSFDINHLLLELKVMSLLGDLSGTIQDIYLCWWQLSVVLVIQKRTRQSFLKLGLCFWCSSFPRLKFFVMQIFQVLQTTSYKTQKEKFFSQWKMDIAQLSFLLGFTFYGLPSQLLQPHRLLEV